MSTSWLRRELASKSDAVTDGGDPVLSIRLGSVEVKVYSPDSDEYMVDSDLVEKAAALGANMIAYSNTWCRVTYEAGAHARQLGVEVMPFGGSFAFLRQRGVGFRD